MGDKVMVHQAADTRHHAYEKSFCSIESKFCQKLNILRMLRARAKGKMVSTDNSFLYQIEDSNQFFETIHYGDKAEMMNLWSGYTKQRMQRMPLKRSLVRQALNESSHVSDAWLVLQL